MELSDQTLLEQFVANRCEESFEAILKRHGPMILNSCKRLLPNPQDAEEAFQATFVLLAQNASSIRKAQSLGSWLYGAAYKTTHRMREKSNLQFQRTKEVIDMLNSEPNDDHFWEQIGPILDEELHALPEKHRIPLISCYLEGRSYQEVADELECTHDQARGRLAQARDILRERMVRRGITLSAAALATLMSNTASAALPSALLQTTLKSAVLATPAAITGTSIFAAMTTKTKITLLAASVAALITAGGSGAYVVYQMENKHPSIAPIKNPANSQTISLSDDQKSGLQKLQKKNEDLSKKIQGEKEKLLAQQQTDAAEAGALKQKITEFEKENTKPISNLSDLENLAQIMGQTQKKAYFLKQRFPKGPPPENSDEYLNFVSALNDITTDVTPLMAQAPELSKKFQTLDIFSEEATQIIPIYYTTLFGASLSLDQNQKDALQSLLAGLYQSEEIKKQSEIYAASTDGQKVEMMKNYLDVFYQKLSLQVKPLLTNEQLDLFQKLYPDSASLNSVKINYP